MLHGDLHRGNVMIGRDGGQLTLIDVDGAVGPAESDLAKWRVEVFGPEDVIDALR